MNKWGSARLQLKQSAEKREYIFWLFGELGNLCRSAPRQKKDTLQWYFSTRYSKELASLWKHFYKDKEKIIPENIDKIFCNPISLAVWFMDDGTLDWREKSHYAFRLVRPFMLNCFRHKLPPIIFNPSETYPAKSGMDSDLLRSL